MPGLHSVETRERALPLELPVDPRLVELRERLERARERGEPFPGAWQAGVAAFTGTLGVAVNDTRSSWARAYRLAAPTRLDTAVARLAEFASDADATLRP